MDGGDEKEHRRPVASPGAGLSSSRHPLIPASHHLFRLDLHGACFSRLLKNSRGSRCQRHGPGCKAPRRRRCLAHRLGAATQQAGPCRGNPSGARDWGPSALWRLLGRGPTLPSSPRLAYGPQASCARPMRVSQQPAIVITKIETARPAAVERWLRTRRLCWNTPAAGTERPGTRPGVGGGLTEERIHGRAFLAPELRS